MRKVIHKIFFIWNFDKEERWLNEMAAKGFALTSVGFCRYEFEDCLPGEYNIRLEMLSKTVSSHESQNYIKFLEETGAEHIGTLFSWVYFRKKAESAPFNLFSDIDSRIRHLNRILFFPGFLGVFNLINAINMTHQYMSRNVNTAFTIYAALIPAIMAWLVSLLMIYGFARLYCKKRRLQKQRVLHE
jgi:hypothetical protein